MPLPAAKTPGQRTVRIAFSGKVLDAAASETILETLIRHGVEAPHSCRKGTCLTCMMRVTLGEVAAESQEPLGETLRDQGYFLPCQCVPVGNLEIASPDDAALYGRARVASVEVLAPTIRRVLLEPATPIYYRAGQFINLRRADGLVRSYSLASVPRIDPYLELHVKRHSGGRMSNWIFDQLEPGEGVDLQGPNGASYYLPGRPDQPILLIGNGSGLAPLIGIARDALHDGHAGPVHLYHGSHGADGLYLRAELEDLAERHGNFAYAPCVSGGPAADCRTGRAEAVAFGDHPDLKGYRVFLSGHPEMVHAGKTTAFLAGAAIDDIHADPFELRDLRGALR